VLKKVPLADVKDDLIERWIRLPPVAKQGGRMVLPAIGKPVAERRGKASLPVAVSSYRRRVAVIAYHYRMAGSGYSKLHSHINYVERPEAGENALTPTLFGADTDNAAGHQAVKPWRDDRHHFRIILAPNDGAKLDMVAFTRDFMREVERTTGTKLEWMAGVHEKPDATHTLNRHAHLIIRGVADNGSDLVLDREYIRHEMRRIAEELATRHLGQMGQQELDAYQARQAERQRSGEKNYNSGRRSTERQTRQPSRPRQQDRGHDHD
jgi:type IV secretory pathway VirD2 relaxase